MKKAWANEDPAKARAALKARADKLDVTHPAAAASLREAMEETLTVNHLGGPESCGRPTNPFVESFSSR